MEVKEILRYSDDNMWHVTFRYWKKGECACTSTKVNRSFNDEPTINDLIASI